MEYVLQVDQITKQYKNFKALDRLSMRVEKGAIYGFVGKNGAGKTTLVRIVCGLQSPTAGLPLLGGFVTPMEKVLSWAAAGCLLVVASAAIFTLIAMLVPSRTVVAVVCLLGVLAAVLVSARIASRLEEPEFHSGIMITADGVEVGEATPNPLYLNENQRAPWQAAMDILPTGQGIQLATKNVPYPWRMALYSGLMIFLANGAGVFFFQRKDLK